MRPLGVENELRAAENIAAALRPWPVKLELPRHLSIETGQHRSALIELQIFGPGRNLHRGGDGPWTETLRVESHRLMAGRPGENLL